MAEDDCERVRFVGKHSRDNRLSVYLYSRTIYTQRVQKQAEAAFKNPELTAILRVQPEFAERPLGECVVVGILCRIVDRDGRRRDEWPLYQQESLAYPQQAANHNRNSQGGASDGQQTKFIFDNSIAKQLPDKYHFPLKIILPANLPPSMFCQDGGGSAPGDNFDELIVSYYVYAYTTLLSNIHYHQGGDSRSPSHKLVSTWSRLDYGNKHSKVFLSFVHKTDFIGHSPQSPSIPNKASAVKNRLLSNPLRLTASLNQHAYPIVHGLDDSAESSRPCILKCSVMIHESGENSASYKMKLTLKQVVVIKLAHAPPKLFKKCLFTKYFRIKSHPEAARMHRQGGNESDASRKSSIEIKLNKYLDRAVLFGTAKDGCCQGFLPSGEWNLGTSTKVSVEYYVNVHCLHTLQANQTVRLPFTLKIVDSGERRCIAAANQSNPMSADFSRGKSIDLIQFDDKDDDQNEDAKNANLNLGCAYNKENSAGDFDEAWALLASYLQHEKNADHHRPSPGHDLDKATVLLTATSLHYKSCNHAFKTIFSKNTCILHATKLFIEIIPTLHKFARMNDRADADALLIAFQKYLQLSKKISQHKLVLDNCHFYAKCKEFHSLLPLQSSLLQRIGEIESFACQRGWACYDGCPDIGRQLDSVHDGKQAHGQEQEARPGNSLALVLERMAALFTPLHAHAQSPKSVVLVDFHKNLMKYMESIQLLTKLLESHPRMPLIVFYQLWWCEAAMTRIFGDFRCLDSGKLQWPNDLITENVPIAMQIKMPKNECMADDDQFDAGAELLIEEMKNL